MLVLTARLSGRESAAPHGGPWQPYARDGLAVAVRAGPLLGFAMEVGDRVVAGESIDPLDEDDARRLAGDLTAGVDPSALLGDRLLLLAVVDPASRTVTLAQSISSSRPCYFALARGSLVFSTSVAGLRDAGVDVSWDPAGTAEFLAYRYVVPPRTILRGVRKLIGGQSLTVDLSAGEVRTERRWSFPVPATSGEDAAARAVETALKGRVVDVVRRSPRAGVLLSGGLDSSLLAAYASTANPAVATFSTNFAFVDENDLEEEYARSMARRLNLSHEVHAGSEEEFLAGWVESLDAAEEPVHHLQSVMLHVLFRKRAALEHGSVLCGEGADGLFGNDAHAFLHRRRRAVAALQATRVGALLDPVGRAFGLSGRRATLLTRDYGRDVTSPRHFLWTLGRYCDPGIVRRVLACDEDQLLGERRGLVAPYRARPLLDQVTAVSLLGEGHATMAIWGKIAEASGFRLVCPFTSPSVVSAVTAAPWDVRLRETKHLGRRALRDFGVPEPLVSRAKLSFGFHPRHWAPKGALFQPVVDMARGAYDAGLLESLQRVAWGPPMILWGLLNQFLWKELFERRRTVPDLAGEILERRRRGGRGK